MLGTTSHERSVAAPPRIGADNARVAEQGPDGGDDPGGNWSRYVYADGAVGAGSSNEFGQNVLVLAVLEPGTAALLAFGVSMLGAVGAHALRPPLVSGEVGAGVGMNHRTPEGLRAMLDQHVRYERQMLCGTASLLGSVRNGRGERPQSLEEWVLENALAESFLVHARNLIEFLFTTGARRDDIVAENYFTDPSLWRRNRGVKPKALIEAKEQADKRLAHLTLTRIANEKVPAPIEPIVAALLGLLDRFESIRTGQALGGSS